MRAGEFERLYTEHGQALYGFLAYRTGDSALAEDLLADTFERALRARRPLDPRRGSAKAWLFTIALNVLRDHARRMGAEQRAYERTGHPRAESGDSGIEALGDREAVNEAMRVLSEEERIAIALRFGAGLTVPEAARVLGEPLQRVEGRVYRALRKLRAALED